MAFEYLSNYFDSWLVLYLTVGYFIGFFFGAVPGLTSTLAISLLLPITFGMEAINALVTCVGIFIGGIYGGGVTGILINIPGAPAAAITVTEGYKLTQKGKAGLALSHGAFSSMVGGVIGALLTIFFIQFISELSLGFMTPDKFSLILMAIVVSMLINSNDILKGIISTFLGLMLAAIGIDSFEALPRMSFGMENIREGISLLTIVVGTFAIAEIFTQLASKPLLAEEILSRMNITKDSYKFMPKFKDIREIGFFCYLRSSIIGFFTGILPGAGAAMAALISYAVSKAFSNNKNAYGKGSLEGITAAETSNNAMCPGAIIPLLTFGIPGDAVTALILGVFNLHGLIPGPMLMIEHSDKLGPMLLAFFVYPFFDRHFSFCLGSILHKNSSCEQAAAVSIHCLYSHDRAICSHFFHPAASSCIDSRIFDLFTQCQRLSNRAFFAGLYSWTASGENLQNKHVFGKG